MREIYYANGLVARRISTYRSDRRDAITSTMHRRWKLILLASAAGAGTMLSNSATMTKATYSLNVLRSRQPGHDSSWTSLRERGTPFGPWAQVEKNSGSTGEHCLSDWKAFGARAGPNWQRLRSKRGRFEQMQTRSTSLDSRSGKRLGETL